MTNRLALVVAGLGALVACSSGAADGHGASTSAGPQGQGHVAKISAHWDHVCAIDVAGALSCWGANESGELGVGPGHAVATAPLRVDPDHTYKDVHAGEGTTCALRDDGSAWCWGRNAAGALATGDTAQHDLPVRIGDRTDYAKIVVGGGFGCALRADGVLDYWGGPDDGAPPAAELGPKVVRAPAPDEGPWVDLSASPTQTWGVRRDGSLWVTDNDGHFRQGEASGARFSVGTDAFLASLDGVLWAASFKQDQLVTFGDDFGDARSISHRACAIRTDGTLWCADEPLVQGNLKQIGHDEDWAAIATGRSFTCGLKTSGARFCWGRLLDPAGQLAVDYGETPLPL